LVWRHLLPPGILLSPSAGRGLVAPRRGVIAWGLPRRQP
jgi:hypothetical protein